MDRALALITSLAALGALYFAWRAVSEARSAQRENHRERLLRRLAEIVQKVWEIDMAYRNNNTVSGPQLQTELQILLVGVDYPLPRTREVAEPVPQTLDERANFQPRAEAAIEEIRVASDAIGAGAANRKLSQRLDC